MAAICMPLRAESKIAKNPNAKTLYITIPAFLAEDSAFPFKAGSKVEVEIVTEDRTVSKGSLVVRQADASSKRK